MTSIVTDLLNPHPNARISIGLHLLSPKKSKRGTNAFSRGDNTGCKVGAVKKVTKRTVILVPLFTSDGLLYPCRHGLCSLCRSLLCFVFRKSLRLPLEGRQDLNEHFWTSCGGSDAASLFLCNQKACCPNYSIRRTSRAASVPAGQTTAILSLSGH